MNPDLESYGLPKMSETKESCVKGRLIGIQSAVAGLIFLITTGNVRADAIDGDWCRADGKRMSIRGSDIVIPSGVHTRGDYSRHAFSYVVPAGEAGAGEQVSIVLLSEYLAHARQGNENTPLQVWNRCQPGVS
jgi:hypothetical protein